uniref:Transposase Tc1-like domain-containing protein n=1 Tax=Scleropages formosus TaxID=113540 RepID=A0A8C9T4M7_SCLFO
SNQTPSGPRQRKTVTLQRTYNIDMYYNRVSVSRVSYTIKRHLETDRKRSGRAKATTESEDKFLRVNSLRDRWLTGQQLQRRLQAAGLTGQVRFAWAMKHRHWITEDWKKVLWTDESKFEIFGSSCRVFVCCRVVGTCVGIVSINFQGLIYFHCCRIALSW